MPESESDPIAITFSVTVAFPEPVHHAVADAVAKLLRDAVPVSVTLTDTNLASPGAEPVTTTLAVTVSDAIPIAVPDLASFADTLADSATPDPAD